MKGKNLITVLSIVAGALSVAASVVSAVLDDKKQEQFKADIMDEVSQNYVRKEES